MSADGEPDVDNYLFDGVHLSARGYSHWSAIIRARLLSDFPAY